MSFYYSEVTAMESEFLTMMDKRWNKFKDYKQYLLDTLPLVEDELSLYRQHRLISDLRHLIAVILMGA